MATLDAEAVAPEVVMAAGGADQSARRIGLKPSLILAAVPDAILRPEHPPPPFAVEHGQVPDRHPERPREQAAFAALIHQVLVTDLCLGEWIDCHAQSIARSETEAQVGPV